MRLASMDVGTNSTRLLIADVEDGRIVAEVDRDMVITRLGKGVDRTRRFDPGALARTLEVIEDYAGRAAKAGAEAVRVAATSATRDAANRDDFLDGVRRLVGVEPEVLSGADEAATSFLGATWDLPREIAGQGPGGPVLVFDIGGGSTELILGELGAAPERAPAAVSVDVGSVRLTERHVSHDPLVPAEVAAVKADARAALTGAGERIGWNGPDGAGAIVGVAGTVTTVTAVTLGLTAYDPSKVHRTTLTLEQVRSTAAALCAITVAEKAAIPVMPPGREDVIAAGALVLESLLEVLGLERIIVSETDILDGILLGLAGRLGKRKGPA
jgi:exopolyphosphatase/guanosine-5'-triphosphate,3'-diphosphate pyrophosphatase